MDNALLLQALNASQPGYSHTQTMDGEAGWEAYRDVLGELGRVGLITQEDINRLGYPNGN